MAEQGVVLDIDTKFLRNLKMADDALSKSVNSSKMITTEFTNMVKRSQTFGASLSKVQESMAKLGSGARMDFGKGLVNINANAMTAADKVNLLTQSVQQLQDKYKELQSTTSKKGMVLKNVSDLTDLQKVEAALSRAEIKLSKGDSPKKEAHLKKQIELYKAAVFELTKSEKQMTSLVIREIQRRVSESNKATNASIRNSEREANAIRRNQEKLRRELRKNNNNGALDPDTALKIAEQAKTLSQLEDAYKKLKKSRDNVDSTTDAGRKKMKELSSAMNETKNKINELNGEHEKLSNSTNKSSGAASVLKGTLRSLFSIYAVKNFVSNIIKVHGAFEMANRSLEILLHSSARAERVWAQIKDLAVKSPFQISELATATKQMAAYNIEASKLFEKTKMLADISAGLGVEMSRLTLAYGQVKAANFLRGTELRQFSEAGIDMLGQLSAYFTDLEGRAVSTAEIFDRMAHRMILFEDVDEVLTRVTSSGGTFYRMQEQQVNTLKGQIRNLKDEIDIMLHGIGSSTHGFFMGLVRIAKYVISHWEQILPVVLAATTAYLTFKTIMWGYGVYLTYVTSRTAAYTAATAGATLATRGFNAALASNPILMVISLLLSAVAGFLTFSSAANAVASATKEEGDSLNKVSKIFREQATEYDRLTDKIMKTSDQIKDLKEEQSQLSSDSARYLEINEELAVVEDQRHSAIASLVNINHEYAKSIDDILNSEDRLIIREKTLKKLYAGEKASDVLNFETIGEYVDVINKAYSEVLDSASRANEELTEISTYVKKGFLSESEPITISIDGKHDDESVMQYMQRLWNIRKSYWDKVFKDASNWNEASYKQLWRDVGLFDMSQGGRAIEKMHDIFAKSADRYMEYMGVTPEDIRLNVDNIQKEIYDAYEAILAESSLETNTKDFIRELLGSVFQFEWPDIDPGLHLWQKTYNSEIEHYIKSLEDQGDEVVNTVSSILLKIRSSRITVVQKKKELDDEIAKLKQQIKDYENGSIELTFFEYGITKTKLKAMEFARGLFGIEPEDPKGPKTTPYKDILKAIDDVHRAYKDLEKDLSSSEALEGAWDKYGAALETALKKIGKTKEWFKTKYGDLDTEGEVTKAMEWLADQAKDADEKFDIQHAMGQWIWELNVETDKKEFDDAVKVIESAFEGYELSIELEKLNLPSNFAEDFFSVSKKTLDDVRKTLFEQKEHFDGTKELEAFENYLKKVDEMETKAQQERLKKYSEYAKIVMGERAQIMIDSFYEQKDIESTFVLTKSLAVNKGLITKEVKDKLDEEGKSIQGLLSMTPAAVLKEYGLTAADLDKIKKFIEELNAEKDKVLAASNEKMEDGLHALDWKEFKGSDLFISVMEDLGKVSDDTLTKMITKIDAYKNEWVDMPYSEMKEMVNLVNKLKSASFDLYKPNEAIDEIRAEMAGLGTPNDKNELVPFTSVSDAQNKLHSSQEKLDTLTEELSIVQAIEALRSKGIEDEALKLELTRLGVKDTREQNRILKLSSDDLKKNVDLEKNNVLNALRYLSLLEEIVDQYDRKAERLSKIKSLTEKFLDGWDSVNSLFKEGSLSSEIADIVRGISSSVFEGYEMYNSFKKAEEALATAGDSAEKFGHKLNAALGIVGMIVSAINLIAGLARNIREWHDETQQKSIDAEIKSLNKLKKKYDELEETMNSAYSIDIMNDAYSEMNANLDEQIEATESLIALESDKKDKDKDKIDEYNEQLLDLMDQQAELVRERFSLATDGVLDDTLDATRGFVDAWYDAFKESGDGISGLNDNFNDMFANILKQQAALTLVGPMIEDFKNKVGEYVDDDGVLGADEARELRSLWDEKSGQINENLKSYFGVFDDILTVDYGELSGLSKGIQGMTEDQAEVLASYWNSCRFILSNIDTTLTSMADRVLGGGSRSNPIEDAIRDQTLVIEEIRDLISGVISFGGASTHSRSYLRVNDA